MKVHIRKLKPKEKIKGEYRGSDRAEEMPVLKVSQTGTGSGYSGFC